MAVMMVSVIMAMIVIVIVIVAMAMAGGMIGAAYGMDRFGYLANRSA